MRRRYRRKKNSIVSVVGDVVHITSELPWWGALLTGVISYLLLSIVLGGYIEGQIASQEGSQYHVIFEARFGRLVNVCNWVGIACFVAGLYFTVRNYFTSNLAHSDEKDIVRILSKLLSRYIG